MLLDSRSEIGSFSPTYHGYWSGYGESASAKELKNKIDDARRISPPSREQSTRSNVVDMKPRAKAVNRLQRRAQRTSFKIGRFKAHPLPELLTNHLVRFKVLVSIYSRYLSDDWRTGIICQLDFLFEPSEWPVDEPLPNETSFISLLKFKITRDIETRPSLGVSPNGRMVASWITERAQLSAEFDDKGLSWGAVEVVNGQQRISSGYLECSQELPPELLAGPWFKNG